MTEKSIFVLRLTGIDLHEINPVDLAKLLESFSKLLGKENLNFESIYKGSAIAKVSTHESHYQKKINHFHSHVNSRKQPIKDIENIVRKYSYTHPNIDAKALANTKSANDEDLEGFYDFDYKQKEPQVFEQPETLRGRLTNIRVGKDRTDHLALILANNEEVKVELSKELSYSLAESLTEAYRGECLIELIGIAKYSYLNMYEFEIKSFKVSDFTIIPETSDASSWFDEFRSKGESGWSQFDDPNRTWLEGRHS